MRINTVILGALTVLFTFLFSACVPAKKVGEITDKYDKCEESRTYLSSENARLEKENTENGANFKRAEDKLVQLAKDTGRVGEQYRQLKYQYGKLQETNAALVEKQGVLSSGSQRENKELLTQLLQTQENLQNKEDSLKLLAYDLQVRKGELTKLNTDLKSREAKVQELQSLIKEKDAAVSQLKNQIKQALIGFEDKGITVEQRNGRVYVSMEAQLLFGSGSTAVSANGKQAVVQLAKALENQEDLTVLVEGHTDSDKMSGKGAIKDNWELSAKRATSVVRIMLSNSKLSPEILTAAGRGEFSPIAPNDTPEGKAKNRRIEVILTPNLDTLFEILEEGSSANAQEVPE